MKRNEMVKSLAISYAHHHRMLITNGVPPKFTLEVAEYLLNTIEKLGMLPPPYQLHKTDKGCMCTMREGCEECDQYGKYFNNSWET